MSKTALAPEVEYLSLTMDEADDELMNATVALLHRVWPFGDHQADRRDRYTKQQRERDQVRIHLLKSENAVVAHALTFSRTALSDAGVLPVTALAGVCVDPDLRRYGLGLRLMEQVCTESRIRNRQPLLFQTEVPAFYEKLSARQVDNDFFNSQAAEAEDNPWWDPHVMIHPADHPWPEGRIDLNGDAY